MEWLDHVDFPSDAPTAAMLAAAAESMSYSEIEERFYRGIDLTPATELDLTEELAQAQLNGHSRLVLWASIQMLTKRGSGSEWFYCRGEQELRAYRARFAAYDVEHTERLDQETLSLALLDNEAGYTQAAALMEFLDRTFQAYYVTRCDVRVDLSPPADRRTVHDSLAIWFGGRLVQHQVEYALVVDFALTRTRRRAPALQAASNRLFAPPTLPPLSVPAAATAAVAAAAKVQHVSPSVTHTTSSSGNSPVRSGGGGGSSSGEGPRLVPVPIKSLSMSSSGSRHRLPPLTAVHEAEEPPPSPPPNKTTPNVNGSGSARPEEVEEEDSGDSDSASAGASSSSSNSSSSSSDSTEDVPLSIVGTGTGTGAGTPRQQQSHQRSHSAGNDKGSGGGTQSGSGRIRSLSISSGSGSRNSSNSKRDFIAVHMPPPREKK